MKSKLILSTTIAVFTLASCVLAEEVKYPPINPALIYWQSAALMPDLKGEKSNLVRDITTGKKPFDATKAEAILSDSGAALRLFARAADSTVPCDWGLQAQDGPAMPLPHVSKIMELSRVAILKADSLFTEGKTSEGIEWLLTVHRAARHAGAGDLLISALVQFSMETSAMKTGALHCLAWDEGARKKYADGLKALPPLHSLQDAFRGEMYSIDWIERHFQPADPKASQALLDQLGNKPGSEFEAQIKLLQEQLVSGSGPKIIAEMRDFNRRTREAIGKPWKEGQVELQKVAEEVQHGNILTRITFAETSTNLNAKQFEIATLRTMLDAALQYGPKLDEAAAAGFKDAFDGEPLVLKKADDGSLTLTTAKQYKKGKDIELKLGK